ncbi:MAG: hypothetical protein D6738_13905 [Acidobacteria bacterium]|nr:MAG: hypothetical protein D6738_13905 [Acidobacteriota bacterium]
MAAVLALSCGATGLAGVDREPVEVPPPPACRLEWIAEETLGGLTHDGVTIQMIPAEPARLFVEYRREGEPRWHATPSQQVDADQAARFRLSGLPPAVYRYRIRCVEEPATGPIVFAGEPASVRPEHRFVIPAPGSEFHFVFVTDSHVYKHWSRGSDLQAFDRARATIRALGPALIVLGGDEVMTHCIRCPEAAVDGESAGADTIRSQREAELRYRQWLRLWSPLFADIPAALVLGNHDGEAGFGDAEGRCGHWLETPAASAAARRKYLPGDPAAVPGGPGDRYRAFVTGDALFVLLDVMGETPVFPESPDDWTLGAAQLAWLEQTLETSDARWKLVFLHHLAGGVDGRRRCYSYGRGSLRATVDGNPDSPFLGEQQQLHTLFVRTGVQAVFQGHDHVFAAGRRDGILYLVGGRPTAQEDSGWIAADWFRELYDQDLDGAPDFLAGPGFVDVTLAPAEARIRYLGADGDTLFEETLDP